MQIPLCGVNSKTEGDRPLRTDPAYSHRFNPVDLAREYGFECHERVYVCHLDDALNPIEADSPPSVLEDLLGDG